MGGSLRRPRLTKTPDVVQNLGACGRGFPHHFGFTCVHRHNKSLSGQRLYHRNHTGELFFKRDIRRARARGFAPDVDDVGAVSGKFSAPGNGRLGCGVFSAVRKGVGRHVHNPHDAGAGQIERAGSEFPGNRCF